MASSCSSTHIATIVQQFPHTFVPCIGWVETFGAARKGVDAPPLFTSICQQHADEILLLLIKE